MCNPIYYHTSFVIPKQVPSAKCFYWYLLVNLSVLYNSMGSVMANVVKECKHNISIIILLLQYLILLKQIFETQTYIEPNIVYRNLCVFCKPLVLISPLYRMDNVREAVNLLHQRFLGLFWQ